MKRTITLLTLILLTGFSAQAIEVQVPVNQAKLEINGAVCAYCAYGMQKSLSKKSWIDKSQGHKGVESDIDNQIITVYLKDGQMVDLKDAYDSIKKGGYEPRTFHLRVQGSPVIEGEQTFLMNAKNKRLFELTGDQVAQIKNLSTCDLQLIIDEDAIGALKNNQPPRAQIHTIF